jgi:hypothetical protein
METRFHANMCDTGTSHVASAMYSPFKSLGEFLSGDYGGTIEHLWIDLELIESHARSDGRCKHPFRFQKRVSGRSHFGLPPSPDHCNVSHYSVRPDFGFIASLSGKQLLTYTLSIIYKSTEGLLEKQKKLGGFDAVLFRERFLGACERLGCRISDDAL